MKQQAKLMDEVLRQSLEKLRQMTEEELLEQRYEKYMKMGQVSFAEESIGAQ
ncbi:hypothetical protein GCM10020331_032260 [Ectobacillus funiculus]